MKRILFITTCMIMALSMQAQSNVPQETPQLEFVMQLHVTLDQPYSVGEIPNGRRTVIPITGGTFEGPLLKGTIINGGSSGAGRRGIPSSGRRRFPSLLPPFPRGKRGR